MATADFTDAFVYYQGKFPTLESLGVNAETWQAELDKVSPEAFDAVLAKSLTFDGGGGSTSFDTLFPQREKVRALYAVRGLRDPDYVNPYTVEPPLGAAPWRMGTVVRLGGTC